MTMEQAFDEWMRMQKEDPWRFQNSFEAAKSHTLVSDIPGVSEYGRDCSIVLRGLMEKGLDFWDSAV